MNNYTITPEVDQTQEFIEIANDFSNPLDVVREAISNAYDAKATTISILFDVVKEYGIDILRVRLIDNGHGMDKDGLKSFFDLGNSLRRDDKSKIGEKGHGTKVFFNCKRIEVITINDKMKYIATMHDPMVKLYERILPEIQVEVEENIMDENGTHISIYGYNNNSMELFTHSVIKDYVLWFTKHGSIEREFNVFDNSDVNLLLKGLDSSESESITHGHIFPPESNNINELFSEYIVKAPDYYCKRVINRGQLKNRPDIHYDAIFSIEGNRVKHGYNDMVRRGGYQAPVGAYTVQERYGLWICKDYIPIQRVNEWIPGKGYEYTKLHAFINCQNLSLTANRGSIDNTPSEILKDLKNAVKNIYEKIIGSDEWSEMEWLEQEASGYRTAEKEKSDYDWRIKKIKRRNTTIYKGVGLIEPERESGVLSIFIQLSLLEKELFPFEIVDYDTHVGIDVIAKGDIDTPIYQSKLYYVEFKNILTGAFNHSFDNLHAIVCWTTSIKNGDVVHDVKGKKRVMKIVKNENCERKFFLDERTDPHRIQVYVLKDYLKEKLNIEFTPNNSE